MWQLLRLVQMYGNERSVTNRSVDDGTFLCGRRSAEYFGAADWRFIYVLESYYYLLSFQYV